MYIVLIAHRHAVKIEEPGEETYDEWQPKLNPKHVAPVVEAWCDVIGMIRILEVVNKEDQGFNKERNVRKSNGVRISHFNPNAACIAKNSPRALTD